MKDRTLQILQVLVQDFIQTAQPVASQRLLDSGHFRVSSATIRNEFSLLEQGGLIHSPHVSAGKVPTEKGYRFFVDQFLAEENPEESESVREVFQNRVTEYKLEKAKENIFEILRILSQLSGNVAFVHLDNDRSFYLGLSHVLRCPEFLEDPEKAAQIIEILEGRERFQTLLEAQKLPLKEVKIFIGEENILEEISSCAMLAVRFQGAVASGTFGILGPMRMKYGVNKTLLESAIEMVM
jgi:heat-inducible transcriptional repressor